MPTEKFTGVKFKTVFVSRESPQDRRLKELAYWCQRFHMVELTPIIEGRSMGNLSFRLNEGSNQFITTASGLGPKDTLGKECFTRVIDCDFDESVMYASGTREPSSESMLHFRIYQLRQDVNAIFHGHYPVILAHARELGIPQTKEWKPYGSLALVKSVEEILGDNDFIVMREHGFLSLGRGRNAMNDAGWLALDKRAEILRC